MRDAAAAIIAACLVSFPAVAAKAADQPAKPLTVNGGVTLVSDYRFRGISQTDRRVALQATLTVAHRSGLYASVWTSSIHDYVANGANAEVDLIAGFKHSLGSTVVDAGVLYYYYPVSGGINSDFVEPYASVTQPLGPVSVKASVAWAPKQHALSVGNGRENNLYVAGDLSYAVPKTPVGLTAHLGHSEGPSYLTIGNSYTDWSVGATASWKGVTAGLSYVDTNKSFITPRGHNASGAGVVASLGASF